MSRKSPLTTAQQEDFALFIASGKMSQAVAYRIAYPTSKKWPDKSVREAASHLAAHPTIRERVTELRKPAAEAAQMTLISHLKELQRLKERCEAAKDYRGATRAEELRGKVSGFYVERTMDVTDPFAGVDRAVVKELIAEIQAAKAERMLAEKQPDKPPEPVAGVH